MANEAFSGSYAINLADVTSAVASFASTAWNKLTSWTRRRARREGGWMHFIDDLETPEDRERAIALLIKIFSAGPLGAQLATQLRQLFTEP